MAGVVRGYRASFGSRRYYGRMTSLEGSATPATFTLHLPRSSGSSTSCCALAPCAPRVTVFDEIEPEPRIACIEGAAAALCRVRSDAAARRHESGDLAHPVVGVFGVGIGTDLVGPALRTGSATDDDLERQAFFLDSLGDLALLFHRRR
jgi:hypothetical protein